MDEDRVARFRALFDPRGVIVAGASTHPGKFGFVALHNILTCGFGGTVAATNRERAEVLGRPTYADIDEIPFGLAGLYHRLQLGVIGRRSRDDLEALLLGKRIKKDRLLEIAERTAPRAESELACLGLQCAGEPDCREHRAAR